MLLSTLVTYFEALAVTDHWPSPVGSHTRPSRGLKALSLATSTSLLSRPLFLSQRTPRLAVSRSLIRHESLKNTEYVLKLVPCVSTKMGCHQISVTPERMVAMTLVPSTMAGALR